MNFLSGLALILLTLVGYSSGTVLAGKGRRVTPELLDLAVVVVLWAAALATRSALGKGLAIIIWLAAALMVAATLTGLRRGRYPEAEQKASVKRQDIGTLRRWWEIWKSFAAEMGNFQGRTLLAFFYFIVVTPFGIPLRLFGDPLHVRRAEEGSLWLERKPGQEGLEHAREQF